jgi:CRP-like cAMP-binding protein
MVEMGEDGQFRVTTEREYQTLFWVPMLFQTAKQSQDLIDDMLGLINKFYDEDNTTVSRRSILVTKATNKRRQQIKGDALDSEVVTTRVEVVLKSENTKYTILSILKRHFLFSQLQNYELEDLIDSMQDRYASPGEVIIKEGDPGDVFVLLEEGQCEISINGEVVGQIEEQSSFGDLALMYNSPRAATITATTECTLWTLDRDFFRQAMVTSSSNQGVQICQFLSKIQLFESLGNQGLNQLARSLAKQSYDDGQYIIRQGEVGKEFFVICKGVVRVTKTLDDGNELELVKLKEGDVFGERALIRKEPRGANVIAFGPVECYYLGAVDFAQMLGTIVDKLNDLQEFRVLKAAPAFMQFSDHRLHMLRKVLQTHNMFTGQRMVCDGINVLIVMIGSVETAFGQTLGVGSVIGSLTKGADKDAGALTAKAEEVVIKSVNRTLLQEYLNDQKNDVVAEEEEAGGAGGGADGVMDAEKDLREIQQRRKETCSSRQAIVEKYQSSSLMDMTILKPLGKGSFGNVFLVKNRVTDTVIALKCLDKAAIVESGQSAYVRREVGALQNFNHPFIGEYFGVLTSARKIFFMLEYIPGGELWSYIYKEGVHGSGAFGGIDPLQAAYYGAIIFMAVEHIHLQGYAYRDLKPENMLICNNGYLKIVDFGFAKQVPFVNKQGQMSYRTFTLCGTPDYMAP